MTSGSEADVQQPLLRTRLSLPATALLVVPAYTAMTTGFFLVLDRLDPCNHFRTLQTNCCGIFMHQLEMAVLGWPRMQRSTSAL